jgi:phenylalanyl-tRNA synthetase beta chain
MYASVNWLNDYLDPPASAEEQATLLTRAGFPLEQTEEVVLGSASDVRQDFEMTSNRGDCVCHLGLAREIAAISGRTLKSPEANPAASGPAAADVVSVHNEEPQRCPIYTARIIRNVKVGPSPAWLADRLTARGDIPRNNLVDATNFVLFELGQPTHVFDLAKLEGGKIVIRMARMDEPFLPIGEGESEVRLTDDDLVIADANRAVAIGGVKGGAVTAVTGETTDVLLEAATFHPVTVRNSSRRHGIASDSSYRYERGVHAAQVNPAADRLAALILELCGGELHEGVVADGAPIPPARTASMRVDRCRKLLGVEIADERMVDSLDRLGFEPVLAGGTIECTVPIHRLDIEREIDLIEEVGRMFGHDHIPTVETISVRVAPIQPRVAAKRAVHDTLAGLGFVEAITHSLIGERAGKAFLPPDLEALRVADERAKAEPMLRPSVLPSLLRVFALNCDRGATDVNLFESASTFARRGADHLETVNLGLLHPAGDDGLRAIRGVIEKLVSLLRGPDAIIEVTPSDALPWLRPGAAVRLDGAILGGYGMIAPEVTGAFDLDQPLCAAEIGLPALYDAYPPDTAAHALPSFPCVERDVTVDIEETVAWERVEQAVAAPGIDVLEALEFVTTFRGKSVPAGRKSLTLRLRFRSEDRTLTHEEVDHEMTRIMSALTEQLSASIRS